MSKKNSEDNKLDFSKVSKYASAPEDTKQVNLKERYDLFINGEFVPPRSKKYFDTINPTTEKPIARIAEAQASDVDRAVKSAKNALPDWQKLPPKERGKYLFRIARAIQERAREFAVIETLDGGKPIRESRDIDIPLVAGHFFYYAGWADKLAYAFGGRATQAKGVCAQIIPWNFPLLMAAWKLAPALAAGNTVVLKPAETTPLTALKLAELIQDIGLPPGVINIITGAGQTGAALIEHPLINKIAFTGSTDIGKIIKSVADRKAIPATLELGGKAAHIIYEDAAIDQAVEGIVNGIFFNQGHVCCAGSRLLVQESIAKVLIDKLSDRMQSLIVGDPLDKNTDIGAINSAAQLEKINGYLKMCKQDGLEVIDNSCVLPKKGYFCRPTLVLNAAQSHKIVQEEIFGPVLAVQTFRTMDEAIEKANNTPYGLSAGVWTQKGSKIFYTTQKLRAGVVWANTFNKFDPSSPFGGYKESGMGREGGGQGLLPYVNML